MTLERLRKQGLRLVIDDTGAGYLSFWHLLLMQPDIIKLGTSLIRGIDCDPARRAPASALITFAKEIGCELVAEGVETDGELADLGITIFQGSITGKPRPA